MALLAMFRASFQTCGLLAVLLAIPIAFDVGGEQCGLAFSLFLSGFYFVVSTLRILFRRTYLWALGSTLFYGQFLITPSMLLVHLSMCPDLSSLSSIVTPWRALVAHSTGLFSLLEGFCTLIVIQQCGRAARRHVSRSDALLLVQLALASLLISLDLWLLVRVYAFPEVVGAATATLIGAALTACLGLGMYGIWSQRGSVVESTLLFSYIVYVIYLTFTDFQSKHAQSCLFPFGGSDGTSSARTHPLLSFLGGLGRESSTSGSMAAPLPKHVLSDGDVAPLPPVIIDSYVAFMTTVAELTPQGVRTMLEFLRAATAAITPSVLVSLVVRLASFFLAMRIVPYIHQQGVSAIDNDEPPIPSRRRRWMVLYAYSPIIIIAVYTHLLMQHFGGLVHMATPATQGTFKWSLIWASSRQAWQFWGWVNVFTTLLVYALELSAGAN